MDLVLDGRDSQDSMTSDSDATISTPGRSLGSMLRQIRKESRRPSQQIHCRRKSNNSGMFITMPFDFIYNHKHTLLIFICKFYVLLYNSFG